MSESDFTAARERDSAARRVSPPAVPDYELIRPIGTGSYGEVWLARSVMGAFRAVKIVYRSSFDHDRPFERELSGIQKFEPISRTHESQVDILHVGRTDDSFYYVMELADGVEGGPDIVPDDYVPKTLRTELHRRGSLPAEECVEIALSLATALAHIHGHGLVHRDIKPSNIIFVGGVPKLADIGLVTDIDATRSFVGTEGFFPPEGPGAPQADLYSLGKVLYEMSTGLDRQDFPELPTNIAVHPESAALLELNAIILKACRPNAADRYQSARSMEGDLILLQTGKSVRRVRLLEHRARRLARFALAACIAGAVLALAFAFQRIQTGRARELAEENRLLAEKGQRLATESRNHLLRMQKINGTRALEAGDSVTAALWFAENLKLAAGDPAQERLSRLQLEWVLGEYPRLERILVHQRGVNSASFSPDGLRIVTASKGGEVRVWDATSGEALTPPLVHDGEVMRASFSPDGAFVLAWGIDGTARVWRASSGASAFPPLRHSAAVTSAVFSPAGDRILTSSSDGTARIWDAASGQSTVPPMQHRAAVTGAVFTPDGERVVSSGKDSAVKIWSARNGELIKAIAHWHPVDTVAITADGRRLLTSTYHTGGTRPSQAWTWDIESGKMLMETPRLAGDAKAVRFSADGKSVILGSEPLWIVNADTGSQRFAPLNQGGVNFIALSPDGTRAATASTTNGAVHVWDVQTGRSLFTPLKHGGWVQHAEFSPDGRRLVTSSEDGAVRIWNLVTRSARIATLRHDQEVWAASFSADGGRILTAGLDGKARLWDVETGENAFPPIENSNPVEYAVFSEDGSRILAAPRNPGHPYPDNRKWTASSVWDARAGTRIGPEIVEDASIFASAITSDGKFLASATESGTVNIREVESGRLVSVLRDQQSRARLLAFSADAERLMAMADGDTVSIWDWRNARQVCPPLKHPAGIRYAAWSPDGRCVATAGWHQAGRVWDAQTGVPLAPPFEHHGLLHYAEFSPDGRSVATCGLSPRVRVWDAATGAQSFPLLEHDRTVNHVAFNPEGTMLLTSSRDKTARIWDLASSDTILPPLIHAGAVAQGHFDSSGQSFATASLDGAVRVWRFPRTNFTNHGLITAATLLSGQTSAGSGLFVPQATTELHTALEELRSRFPSYFQVESAQVAAWHEASASTAEDLHQWAAAAWHLNELIAQNPQSAQLAARRGNALAELSDWAGAQRAFESAVTLGGESSIIRRKALLSSWKAGEQTKAREHAMWLIERVRTTLDPVSRGDTARFIPAFPGLLEDYSETLEFAKAALTQDSNNPAVQEAYVGQLYRAGRYAEAAEYLRTVVSHSADPRGSPGVLYFRTMVLTRQGNQRAARNALNVAHSRLRESIQDRWETNEKWDTIQSWKIIQEEAQSQIEN